MTEIVISNLLGFVLGIVASFISWWILFHVLVPKIEFGEHLLKTRTDDDASGWRYLFHFKNTGARRIIDGEVTARHSVRAESGGWRNTILALDWTGDKKIDVPIINKGALGYRIFLNKTPGIQKSARFSDSIREKSAAGSLLLEDLLADDSSITITVAGSDELSGARRVFQSKAYRVKDVRQGRFENLSVVPVPETEDARPKT